MATAGDAPSRLRPGGHAQMPASAAFASFAGGRTLGGQAGGASSGGGTGGGGGVTPSPKGAAAAGGGPFGVPLSGAEREQAEAYFTDLLSYSLERLSKEPQLLEADQVQLERQAQEAAVTHYRAFIDVAGCLATMRDEMESVGTHLDGLLEGLPTLNAACDTFTEGAKTYAAKRSDIKQLHRQHPVLLELLEVPQLMDTCVRNGNYDDALDLRAFISKMAVMHPNLEVVKSLVKEVDVTSGAMLEALLGRLRAPIQLPECLRVVGHLRRLAAFTEGELRRHFLQCREEWLAEVVEELEAGATYDYIKRLTDVHRLHLFDVIMQYRAIFSDDASPGEAAAGPDTATTVYGWAQHRVVFYLDALREALPRVTEGGNLASVLEHCMYCGMSLSRVGLDFRGLLPPIFEASVRETFARNLKAAVDTFLLVLDVHKWVALPSMAGRARRPASGGLSGTGSTGGTADDAGRADDSGPPYILMDHAPLAILTNGLLASLNELRHCAPLALAQDLSAILQDALEASVQAMAHCKATRLLPDEEAALMEGACDMLTGTVVPYIISCFAKVYPGPFIDTSRVVAALAPPPAPAPPPPAPASAVPVPDLPAPGAPPSLAASVIPPAAGVVAPSLPARAIPPAATAGAALPGGDAQEHATGSPPGGDPGMGSAATPAGPATALTPGAAAAGDGSAGERPTSEAEEAASGPAGVGPR